MLKEYQAQKEYIFPPRPSMRIVVDVIRFCAAEMPRFHPVSVSGYHIREAGSTAAQELAFTLANGFAYVEAALASGSGRRRVRPPAQLLLQRPSRFLRGDRQVPRRPAYLGAVDGRTATGPWPSGRCSCASTPRPPVSRSRPSNPRSTSSAPPSKRWPGCSGGTQSLHTNSMDEVFALPTEKAARIALRTQQVLAHETG